MIYRSFLLNDGDRGIDPVLSGDTMRTAVGCGQGPSRSVGLPIVLESILVRVFVRISRDGKYVIAEDLIGPICPELFFSYL